ncbi:class I SAM-dependent methyltransferase [Flavobacterium supellecticarium]|uniref:Class I SAM-dependent methyltransferase n=1 Tax=Flavobacterium supellecticarium TaxID=2565924 RepID=A0A4S3ZW83_9FLAO|nr:class I SAM-dependent methyltransferase [Flavobacterium supellecticarium]
MITYPIKAYLKFLWHSKNQHGVHSPFVFRLVTKCFYDKKSKPEYATLGNYRKALLQNTSTISVTDFGAGSRVFKSNNRSVAHIAKNAGISKKRARLLFRLVRYFQPENILEIGTSLGLATASLASGNSKANITTIEGCPETARIARENMTTFGYNNIDSVVSEFQAYLNTSTNQNTTYDLIYFDGNHQKEATLRYFDTLLPTITNDTLWIFDDIHWSADMEEAWQKIKEHPQVTVTIDTFQWGLVFFRREQEKEHFIIRV